MSDCKHKIPEVGDKKPKMEVEQLEICEVGLTSTKQTACKESVGVAGKDRAIANIESYQK